MLETIHIQNYALIDELEIEFGPGLNVLTGETGAGKSIIVGALNLVLGARASTESVRQGAKRASVEAVFRLVDCPKGLRELLDEHDVELEDGRLILARSISSDGRSKAYAGGSLAPAAVLAEIGDELVDLHGQHEHQSLLRADRQLALLDAFAGIELQVDALGELVGDLRRLEREVRDLESDDRERERRLEFLRFEVGEIDAAELSPGEEEEVRQRRSRIENAERLVELSNQVYESLYEHAEGAAAVDQLDQALTALEELAAIDERFGDHAASLERVRVEIEEIARDVGASVEDVEFDEEELDALNQRLTTISGLKRKYGETVDEVLAYRARAANELAQYERRDERLAELQAEREQLLSKAESAAAALSKRRKRAADKLHKKVTEALQELGMKGGSFAVSFEEADLGAKGVDRVAFMLSANVGERPKPLRQVASGGEISRVMLALKTVFASADSIGTLVFDEIDAGVGGAVAKHVARRLGQLAESHQTLCITHLAQIAATASRHFHISKDETNGRTSTRLQMVESDERVRELARLLDGSVSDVSLEHARALLTQTETP